MLEQLITSKTRMKLLMKFFSNSTAKAYLRGLSSEMGESTNAIRLELNRLSAAGLLEHEQDGNTVLYRANTTNPFFREIQRLVMKYMGLDNIVELVTQKLGRIELAFISGDYAKEPCTPKEAKKVIASNRGKLFCPDLCDHFVTVLDDLLG